MIEFDSPTKQEIEAGLILQDDFFKAYPSQDLLEDIPADLLPNDYREAVRLRMDKSNFYVAFSDNVEDLEPTEGGFLPNAHLKKIPAMTGPRRLGTVVKEWIDDIREAESKK